MTVNKMTFEHVVVNRCFTEYILGNIIQDLPIKGSKYGWIVKILIISKVEIELILSDKVVAVGISQRTNAKAFRKTGTPSIRKNSGFEKVLAIKIPNNRAMMHLDTVFTNGRP